MAYDPAECRKEADLLMQRARTSPPALSRELVEMAEMWMKKAAELERKQRELSSEWFIKKPMRFVAAPRPAAAHPDSSGPPHAAQPACELVGE